MVFLLFEFRPAGSRCPVIGLALPCKLCAPHGGRCANRLNSGTTAAKNEHQEHPESDSTD